MGTELLYLLIGAGLTMTAQAVIQLRVVPRVEARKRREDRWERDLLALGELLTAELPERASTARSAQWLLQTVSADLDERDVDVERRRDVERELQEEAAGCVKSYQALARTRVKWLANRIVGVAPQHADLEKFNMVHTRFEMVGILCTLYIRPESDFDEEKFERHWKDERKLREELTQIVEVLIRNPPPLNPSRLRLGKWRLNRSRKTRMSKAEQRRETRPAAEA